MLDKISKMKRKLRENTETPLECQDPDKFGDLDDEQIFLYDNNALDLILIENASELVRQVMMKKGNIEKILNLISETYEGCGVLPSDSFEVVEGEKTKQYLKAVERMKKNLKKIAHFECIFAVFGLIVSEDGSGHYGSFFKRKNEDIVYIFDSMSPDSEFKEFFAQLGKDVFNVENIVFDERFTFKTSLQLTGGFTQSDPLSFEENPEG